MVTARDIPEFSDHDRLGLTVFGSILAHMVIILGVTFAAPRIHLDRLATLEITLVQTRSDQAPEAPQFLAQAHQDGGGDSERALIARSPLPVQELSERLTPAPGARPKMQPPARTARALPELMTDQARRRIRAHEPRLEKKPSQPLPPEPGLARDLAQERARLTAEISRSWQEYQKRPQRKFVNARTQEYKYAAYLDAWRAKVERVGNLNYPEQARRLRLSGKLLLDVALNPDGSLNQVTIRRPSGHKLLDDAAVRIVELAAPFPPFPPEIRADTDILHITRTWKFNDSALTSGSE